MHRMILWSMAVWLGLAGGPAIGGSIYTWTDADGVKRFSNSQPPEEAENVQIIDEVSSDTQGDDRIRQEYDRMVEDASRNADRYLQEQAEKKAREAEDEQSRRLTEQSQQMEAERARLQAEIDAIQGRGLGPTFSAGMKENLIRQLQERIDQLGTGPAN